MAVPDGSLRKEKNMNAQEKIDQLVKAEMEHIRSVGGILNLPEADSVLNDLNREKLKALKELHGHLYLGRINNRRCVRGNAGPAPIQLLL